MSRWQGHSGPIRYYADSVFNPTGFGGHGGWSQSLAYNTHTVTLDRRSGSGGSSSVTATRGYAMPSATAPTRTGYTFQGYFDQTNGNGTRYYNANMSSARTWNKAHNDTLYAHWTANTYTVTLNRQNGSGGSGSVTATYDAAMPSATAPSRTGYTFQGYFDQTNGNGTRYYNANMSSARTWNKANNDTLYAHWTPRQYTVTLDRRGGSGGSSSVTATYDANMPSATAPSRTGYTFQGYFDQTNGNGTRYYNANMSSARTWNKAHNDTLYAHWASVGQVETPAFNPDGGAHPGSSVNVTVTCATAGATIRYTTNGSEPTTSSPTVSSGSSVQVPVPGTLKAKAWKDGMTTSVTKTANYTSSGSVSTPAFNPDGGAHSGSSVNVTITCATAGATIRYTTNGSEPTTSSPSVSSGSSVQVPVPGTLKAKAWKDGMTTSATKTADYTSSGSVSTPAFNPDGGAHPGSSVSVTITCATAGATIRYTSGSGTTLGADPTTSSTVVPANGVVSVPVPGWLKARAWKDGMDPSGVKSAVYTLEDEPSVPGGMVLIPGGTNSGTDPDFGAYSLTVSSFHMDRYPVTKALWDEVYNWAIANGYSFDNAGSGKAANHPVHSVSWYDAVKWCNARSEMEGRPPVYTVNGAVYRTGRSDNVVQSSAAGYRLPTDVEWVYAARGGLSGRRFPWGDSINHNHANYRANGSFSSYDTSPYTTSTYHPTYNDGNMPYTSPVGSFAANGYGLYDMAGNVLEWCFTASGSDRGSIHGGSWDLGAFQCQVGVRGNFTRARADNDIGFRAVLPPSVLNLDPTSRDHSFGSTSGQTISVSGNVSWTASRGGDSWITITSGSSGSGDGTVTYSVSENTSTASRSGTITVSGGGITRTFSITQSGAVGDDTGNTIFPLSYPGRYVTAFVYDAVEEEWLRILDVTLSPTSATFPMVQAGRWYWLAVMVYNPTSQEWELSHGSWFGRH